MWNHLIVVFFVGAASCGKFSTLTPSHIEKLTALGYKLDKTLSQNLYSEWNHPLLSKNPTVLKRLNLCYDPSINITTQINLFEDRMDKALDTFFSYYKEQNKLDETPFEQMSFFLDNVEDFLHQIEKCVNSKSELVNRMGINSNFVLNKHEKFQLDLPNDFFLNKLGSTSNFENRTKSCTQVLNWRATSPSPLPDSFNWADYGVVTPIKAQGGCGSCVTFGTIGATESAYHLQLGKAMTNMSEQDVLNCFANFGLGGCIGSWPDELLDFLMLRGLSRSKAGSGEQSEYKGKVMNCEKVRKDPIPEMIQDYCFFVDVADDEMLKSLIYDFGPTIIPLSCYDDTIYFLKNESFKTGCANDRNVNKGHVMHAVGWTEDYFIIKNSWGSTWGSNGFLHLARNDNTKLCNYLNFAVVPIFKEPSESLGAWYEFENLN